MWLLLCMFLNITISSFVSFITFMNDYQLFISSNNVSIHLQLLNGIAKTFISLFATWSIFQPLDPTLSSFHQAQAYIYATQPNILRCETCHFLLVNFFLNVMLWIGVVGAMFMMYNELGLLQPTNSQIGL
jgi:hypothetical protein